MDYYKILGIPKSTCHKDIKTAYKILASEYHPDKNLDNLEEAEAKFKDIQKAFKVLWNPKSRKLYDETGTVEEVDEITDYKLANMEISRIINMLLDQNFDQLDNIDFIESTLRITIAHQQSLESRIRQGTVRVVKFTRALGRVRYKGDSGDLISAAIQTKIDNIERAIEIDKHRLGVLDIAIEILDDYEFHAQLMIGTFSGSVTSTTSYS